MNTRSRTTGSRVENSCVMKIARPATATAVSAMIQCEANQSVLLPLVEHHLQRAHPHRQQTDAPVVDAQAAPPDVGRIEDEHRVITIDARPTGRLM